MAQGADLAARSQGQCAVVFEQDGTLAGKLLGDLLVVGFQFFHAVEIAFKVDRLVIGILGGKGGGLQGDVYRLRAGKGQLGADAGRRKQYGEQHRQNREQRNAAALLFCFAFHFSSPYIIKLFWRTAISAKCRCQV